MSLVVASISARKGSKGVPGKNLRLLNGRSLIERALDLASSIDEIDVILFSSDSDEMLEVADKYGAFKIRRPESLADDKTSLHMVTKYNVSQYSGDVGCVVQLAPTCPFLKKETVSRGIDRVVSGDYSSAVSLCRIEHSHPYRAREITSDNSFVNFIKHINVEDKKFHSRQDLPELWSTTGGLYIRDISVLNEMSGDSFGFGLRPYALKLEDIEAVNIDREIDLKYAEFLSSYYQI